MVLCAEHVADQDSIDIVLGDNGALELGKVEAVSKSRLIQFSLVPDSLSNVTRRVLGDRRSLRLCHLRIALLLTIES
jgi:hypothetical protein